VCGEVTLWEAWCQWWTGAEVKECLLLGTRIIWWGRAGKFAGLLSAMVIWFDILGPEPFARFGSWLRSLARRCTDLAREVFARLVLFISKRAMA
jgi:hypothetical protein